MFSVPLEEFVNNVTAIQCTEVYEYSMSLGNPHFVLPSFQLFRFLYLVRLVDYGLLEEVMSVECKLQFFVFIQLINNYSFLNN